MTEQKQRKQSASFWFWIGYMIIGFTAVFVAMIIFGPIKPNIIFSTLATVLFLIGLVLMFASLFIKRKKL